MDYAFLYCLIGNLFLFRSLERYKVHHFADNSGNLSSLHSTVGAVRKSSNVPAPMQIKIQCDHTF